MKTSTTIRTNGAICIYALLISLALFCGNALMAQNDALFIAPNGNVGIGTTSPNATLHVFAPITTAASLQWGATAGTIFRSEDSELAMGLYNSSPWAYWLQARTKQSKARDIVMQPLGGNVGIGTTNPSAPLQVTANGTGSPSTNGLYVYNPNEGQNAPICARVKGPGTNIGKPYISLDIEGMGGWSMGINNSTDKALSFRNAWDFSGGDKIILLTNGNVGIGTSNPTEKLEIASGKIKAKDFKAPDETGFRFYDNDSDGYLQIANAGHTWITSSSGKNESSVIFAGWVGIYNRTPEYPLDIGGSVGRSWDKRAYGYFDHTGSSGICQSCGGNYSIHCDGKVLAEGFDANSDKRIKDIIGISDTRKDLELINRLEVTLYQYTDRIQKGNSIKQGFIAQQVEEVIPEAVSYSKDFVPDIYAIPCQVEYVAANKNLKIALDKPHGLAVADLVRVYSGFEKIEKTVSEIISENEFVLSDWEGSTDSLFVYGKKVDDLRSLDYDRIFTIGIGAIQELDSQLKTAQAQIEALEKENKDIKAENEAQNNMMKEMKAQIGKISGYLNMTSQK